MSASGTRQAAAVMGGSAEITQVGFAHTMHAVGRGGELVGICTAFDVYPIALVLSNDGDQAAGHHRHHVARREDQAREGRADRHHLARFQHRRVHAHHHAGARHWTRRAMCNCSRSASARRWSPRWQAGATDGFAFMSPFTDMAVSRGIGQIIADPMTGKVPEYQRRAVSGDHHQPRHAGSETPAAAACRARADQGDEVRARGCRRIARKIVRTFFQDTPEAEFNTAFNTYIKAVPTTPVISQAQVDNTVKMVNLTEKTPITATYDQVVYPDLAREAAKDMLGK